MPSTASIEPPHDPYAALRIPSVALYLGGNFVASMGYLMKDAAILWEVYDRTGSYRTLGFVGLLQAVPVIALPLLTGHLADRFPRKRIMFISLLLLAATALALAVNSLWIHSMPVLYTALGFHGVVRAFQQPARQSLLPQIATPETFPNAVTWGTGAFHLAQVLGPISTGFILHWMHSAWLVYFIYAVMVLIFFAMLWRVEARPTERNGEAITLATVTGGLTFVFRNKLLLTAMCIDLFAVLLGGATGMLPVFQKEILKVDPIWYGVLRRSRHGCRIGVNSYCTSPTICQSGQSDAAGRCRLFAGDDSVWTIRNALANAGGAVCFRRLRHHQRCHSSHDDSNTHARPHARPCVGNQRHVHWRFELPGRRRSGLCRQPCPPLDGQSCLRSPICRRQRRCRFTIGSHRRCHFISAVARLRKNRPRPGPTRIPARQIAHENRAASPTSFSLNWLAPENTQPQSSGKEHVNCRPVLLLH